MASLAARDSSVRSIRNVLNYTQSDNFDQSSKEEVQTRCEYLQTSWQSFCERNDDLIQRARENDDADRHLEMFDEIEMVYLDNGVLGYSCTASTTFKRFSARNTR